MIQRRGTYLRETTVGEVEVQLTAVEEIGDQVQLGSGLEGVSETRSQGGAGGHTRR